MTYNIDNLTAGLDTFAKPDTRRYTKATKAFNNKLTAGTPHRQAVDETLKEAINGLAKPEEKLQAARKAAGIFTRTQSIQTGASTAATAIIAQAKKVNVPKIKKPSFKPTKEYKSPIRRFMEKRALAKVRASNDPSIPPKPRKGTIFLWIVIGVFVGVFITFAVQGVLLNFSGGTGSFPWVPFLVHPFTIAICFLIGYIKASKPKSTDDSEDGPFATSHPHTQA